MRYLLLAGLVAVPMVAAPPAQARDYPWCAVYNASGDVRNCGFDTFAQCRATVSGAGGLCERNPLYAPPRRVRRER